MNQWILQMGFPVVTINTRTGRIKQKHFLLDPDSVVGRLSLFKSEKLNQFFMQTCFIYMCYIEPCHAKLTTLPLCARVAVRMWLQL